MKYQSYDFLPIHLQKCVVVGGCGFALDPGEEIGLLWEPGKLSLVHVDAEPESVLYPEIIQLRISGPGKVTSGGGFVGGGFGVESAVHGMAAAAILNLLTTTSRIHAYIAVSTLRGELHLHYAGMEPAALEIALSPVLTALRRLQGNWIETQLERLEQLKQAGIITERELVHMREMVTDPPRQDQLKAQTRARQDVQSAAKARAIKEAELAEAAARKLEPESSGRLPTPGKQVDITFFGKKI